MDLASVLAALSAAGGASGMPGVDEPLDDDTISQIMADGYQGGKKPPSQLTLQEDVIDVTVSASRLARCSACPICCDPFKVGDDARELPCGHFFDDHCIVTWLEDVGFGMRMRASFRLSETPSSHSSLITLIDSPCRITPARCAATS